MTLEQAAPLVISIGGAIYAIYRSGKTDDDRTRQIAGEMLKSHAATTDAEKKAHAATADAEKKITDLQFAHMADNISQIRDSIATLLRKLEESVASKQDVLQLDSRLDALEESNRDHYEARRKTDAEISSLRVSCARYHRTLSDSSAFPKDRT